jgi:nitrate reductase gamma subunit
VEVLKILFLVFPYKVIPYLICFILVRHTNNITEDKTTPSSVTFEVLLLQFLTPLHVSVLIDHHQRDIDTAWKPLLQWVFRLLKCIYIQ